MEAQNFTPLRSVGMRPVYTWWNSFTALMGDYYANIGPQEYGYILIVTGIAGWVFLRSGSR